MLWYPSCARWHDTSNANWISNTSYGFYRGGNGVFSFNGNNNWTSNELCGRGVAVIKPAVRAERVTDGLCDGTECSVRHRTLI